MIKPPEIPTDNLYKFIAIFGLILAITSTFIIYNSQIKFYNELKLRSQKTDKCLADISNANTEILFLQNKIELQKKILFSKYGYKSDFDFSDSLNFKNSFSSDSFKKEYFFLLELKESVMKKNDLIERIDENLIEDVEIPSIYFYSFLLLFGLVLIFFGFYKWYYKTQKLIDKQLLLNSISKSVYDDKLKAFIDFNTIYYKNKKYDSNTFDYDDYLEKIVIDFERYITLIEELIINSSKYFNKEINAELTQLKAIAIDGKQEISEDFEINEVGYTMANKFDNQLNVLKNKLEDFYKDLL